MPFISAYAPGHVELLRNQMDYNKGYVLSAAIDRGAHIEVILRKDDKIALESATMGNGSDLLEDVLYRRSLHVVEENASVLKGIGLLRELDIRGFGELMFESHESLQINFENSTPELDTLVDIAHEVEGLFGSRLVGGGFGGATASLVSRKAANSAAIEFAARYKERTGLICETYVCEIAEGAH